MSLASGVQDDDPVLHFAVDDGIVVVEVERSASLPTSRVIRRKRGRTPMTTAEYLRTPETLLPRELAYGVLRVADAPIPAHQRVVRDLLIAIDAFVRARHLGEVLPAPVDVILDFERALVVQPDLLFVSSERRAIVSDHVYGAPDIVAEVLSPHPRIGRLEERLGWFARYGVRECWLLDLSTRDVTVLELTPAGVGRRTMFVGGEPIRSSVVGELTFSATDVFGY